MRVHTGERPYSCKVRQKKLTKDLSLRTTLLLTDLFPVILPLNGSEIASANAHWRKASRVQTVQEVFCTAATSEEAYALRAQYRQALLLREVRGVLQGQSYLTSIYFLGQEYL